MTPHIVEVSVGLRKLRIEKRKSMALEADPSNQTSGLIKIATAIVSGWLASHYHLDPTTAGGFVGDALTVGTIIWQIIHRMKTARAIKAAAALPSNASPAVLNEAVKSA